MTSYKKKILLLFTGVVLICTSCTTTTSHDTTLDAIETVIAEVETSYVPDKRVAIFDIETSKKNDTYTIKGSSNLPKAVDAVTNKLKAVNIRFVDSIEVLPTANLEGKIKGVIKLSVANLRGNPKHSAELVTQGTLGTPVKIYKKKENWYLIQTPDQYIAWVDSGGLEPMDSTAFEQWQKSKKLIYTKTFGNSYQEPNPNAQVVSDLVAGNVLTLIAVKNDFYEVAYPDGRTAYISEEESAPYDEWIESLQQTKESLVTTSKTLMGLPYLWGGTSSKGVDCSGFTKTIYFLNGMVIPRDASQQIHEGVLVDSSSNFDKLQSGDLLFFGKKATDSTKERVVHVGMWIGNNEFIHSAGRVHISSMDKNAPNYDEYNYNRYLRTKRMLDEDSDGLINLKEKELF